MKTKSSLINFRWGFFLISFLAITFISIESPTGISLFPLLIIFVVPVLFILWLLKVEHIKKLLIKPYVIPLLFSILLSFIVTVQIIKSQCAATESSANQIIIALEKYHSANSKYPSTLIELKKGYLTEIPKTKMGWLNVVFDYAAYNDSQQFMLDFKYIAVFRRVYISDKKMWSYE